MGHTNFPLLGMKDMFYKNRGDRVLNEKIRMCVVLRTKGYFFPENIRKNKVYGLFWGYLVKTFGHREK